MTARKPKPPFAHRWLVRQPAGSVKVFAGKEAWDRARKNKGGALVAPLDRSPAELDWSFLAGHDVLLLQFGACPVEHLQRVAEILVCTGIEPVVVLPEAGRRIVVFRHG